MIVQCDFDGTITLNNMSHLLRESFAPSDWKRDESDYLNGLLTVEQSNRLQYTMIREPKEKLQQFVLQHIEIRPGFIEFVNYCRENSIQFVVVSSGLDFYIETVLAHIGMGHLELYCARTSFTENGIAVSYYDPDGNAIEAGFKKKYLVQLKKRDTNLVYIGDGLSDVEAASHACHVFATGHLSTLLRAKSVNFDYFDNFYYLIDQVKLLS